MKFDLEYRSADLSQNRSSVRAIVALCLQRSRGNSRMRGGQNCFLLELPHDDL